MKPIPPMTARCHFTTASSTRASTHPKCYCQWFRQLADSVLRHDHGQVAALLKSIPTLQDPNTLLADPRGTTLLHLACSFNKHRCVSALVSHASASVNLPDVESGWTPLHRALYAGNLRAANHLLLHPQIDINAIDAHGHTPLHLLHHLTLPPLPLTAPTDMFSWGSNANYVLGHGHSTTDSSASTSHLSSSSSSNAPDPQPKRTSFRPHDNLATYFYTPDFAGMPTITHLSVAKYHACMLTHDPTTNHAQLYMWGYASGGRLGSTATSAVVKPTLAQFDHGTPTFTAVAAAHNHTLAITPLGTVWVWGSNQFGQCGLSLDTADIDSLAKGYPKAYVGGGGATRRTATSADSPVAPRPLTTGHLKREPMAPNGGVTASKIHSCVWTRTSLVTFGLNVGQLGHGRDSIVVQPRKVTGLPLAGIVDVKCTERFTLVLLDSGAAFVLQDFTTRRLKLAPVAGIRTSDLGKAAGWSQAAPMRPPAVRRISVQDSGGISFGAVVTVQGHVCAWSVAGTAHPPPAPGSAAAAAVGSSSVAESADMQDEGKKWKSALKWTPPKYVWTPTGALRGAGEAVDVAIGLDGALAVVTEFGSMYSLRSTWTGPRMPTWSTFALDRATHVFANGHGSWFALRSNAVVAVPKEATEDERAREWHRPGRDEDARDVPDKVVLVSVDGTRHEIHTRLVLDFDWFQTALSSSWTSSSSLSDSATPAISLTDFSSATLSALDTWLHSRTFSLPYPALLSLLALADFLLLDHLKAQLAYVLAQCASPHNLVDLLNTALDVNAKHLERACARLVVANFSYLAKKHAMGKEAWDRAVAVAEHVCKEEQDGFAPLSNGWKRVMDRPVAVAKMAGWNWYFPVASSSGSAAGPTVEKVEATTIAESEREQALPVQDENAHQPKGLPVTPKQQVQQPSAAASLPSPPPPPQFTPVAVKKVSLAQIQAQEEAKKRLRRTAPAPAGDAASPSSSSSASRPATAPTSTPMPAAVVATSPVPIRLVNVSQKERKRQSKNSGAPESAVSHAPWATPSFPASLVSPAIAPAAGGGVESSSTAPWSKPSAAAASPAASGSSSLWPSLASAPEPAPAPSAASSSFAAIQKEQLQAKSTKHQQVKKALAEIQIEEAAMAQLLDRFRARRGAGLISGEMMSVVVVPR